MKTVLMAVAVVEKDDSILLRKMDEERNPYNEPWAIFGGKIDHEGVVEEILNHELRSRWNFAVEIEQRLWWDEEVKVDSDGEQKHFIYLDVLCRVVEGEPNSNNLNEELTWVPKNEVLNYELNPPTRILLGKLGYA